MRFNSSFLLKVLFLILISGPWSSFRFSHAEDFAKAVDIAKSDDSAISNDSAKNGLQHYQQKKISEAIADFKSAINGSPNNAYLWHNLGLAYLQNSQKGLALASLRRSKWLNSSINTNKPLQELIIAQLPIKEIPHEIEWIHELHKGFLSDLNIHTLMSLLAVLTLLSGWMVIKTLSRKQNKSWNWVTIIVVFLELFFIILVFLKGYDQKFIRATVLPEKISVFAVPQLESAAGLGIFEVYEGFEIIVLAEQKSSENIEWVQIQYPGAGIGWIKRGDIFIHSKGL